MIAVIVCSIVFIMGIILIICGIISKKDEFRVRDTVSKKAEFLGIGTLISIVSISIIVAALCCGRSIYKKDNTKILAEKKYIEYCLEIDPSLYIIKEAEIFNTNLDVGNNYFCRFSKEDRSEFKINIDKYISGGDHE